MQYIEKKPKEPDSWNDWFLVTVDGNAPFRTWNFRNRPGPPEGEKDKVKECLIKEQNGLCAYCQKSIDIGNSSVDHVLPHGLNGNYSTHYHNLVAVCKDSKVVDGKAHCDTSKGQIPNPHLIFWNAAQATEAKSHPYFTTEPFSGQVLPKEQTDSNLTSEIQAFVSILNLDHQHLRDARKEYFDPIYQKFVRLNGQRRIIYAKEQIQEILNDPSRPFRQFLLISLHQLIKNR